MTTDPNAATSPEGPADVGAPTSSGVEVAPTEPASVAAGAPQVDTAWFPQETAMCGDTLEVRARLTAEGFDGAVDFQYKNARARARTSRAGPRWSAARSRSSRAGWPGSSRAPGTTSPTWRSPGR
ncbi:MAG: hypothetical protein IPF99_06000 [Deltaproteobacteria bacterium]|nr:hypothetical protein [Deltaproteobacteria bacterium]